MIITYLQISCFYMLELNGNIVIQNYKTFETKAFIIVLLNKQATYSLKRLYIQGEIKRYQLEPSLLLSLVQMCTVCLLGSQVILSSIAQFAENYCQM